MKRHFPLLVSLALVALIPFLAGANIAGFLGGNAPVVMDMYWSGDGPAGTVTLTTLAAQCFTTDSNPWSLPDATTGIDHDPTGNLAPLRNPISVNGTAYTGVNTNGFRINNTVFSTLRALRKIDPRDTILVGFFFKANPEMNYNYTDLLNMEGSTGADWAVAQWASYTPLTLRVHSAAGTNSAGNATNSTLYWIQLKYVRNSVAAVAAWSVSGSTYTFLGTNTIAMNAADLACNRIYGPMIGAHGQTSPSSPYYYSCNYVFQWTNPGSVDTLML